MLEHASGSRHIDPGRPPAAAGGLVSQVPDLVLGPRQPLDSGELQQAGRRDTTRSFDMRSKACIDWAASAVTPGRRSLEWSLDEHGRATKGRGQMCRIRAFEGF